MATCVWFALSGAGSGLATRFCLIAMASSTSVLASGQYAGATTLARSIITSQTVQIAQLQKIKTQPA